MLHLNIKKYGKPDNHTHTSIAHFMCDRDKLSLFGNRSHWLLFSNAISAQFHLSHLLRIYCHQILTHCKANFQLKSHIVWYTTQPDSLLIWEQYLTVLQNNSIRSIICFHRLLCRGTITLQRTCFEEPDVWGAPRINACRSTIKGTGNITWVWGTKIDCSCLYHLTTSVHGTVVWNSEVCSNFMRTLWPILPHKQVFRGWNCEPWEKIWKFLVWRHVLNVMIQSKLSFNYFTIITTWILNFK